ncbi:hypothetical protein [Streptomyces sp. IBSBF 2950]|uniref:hypothetical protein n=1 Tax=Streptomyces sp. IBSBF 2950 TaxID=2903528 RepID=UPI002FDBA58D
MTAAVTAPVVRMARSLPAAARVRALHHVGLTDREIIARARITAQQLRRAGRGDLIGWEVERRILALPIPNEASLYEQIGRPIGARRRIRALRALGWPLRDLAAALDWPIHKVGTILAERPIYIADFLAVCALYDQRWTWIPEEHGIPADEAEQARLAAELGQCVSPLAWDDEALDDPKARPRTGPSEGNRYGAPDSAAALRALDGDNVRLSGRTRTLAIAYGARHLDMPWDVMAERLGMDEGSLRRTWERIKRRVRDDANGATTWVDDPRFTDPDYIAASNQYRTAA